MQGKLTVIGVGPGDPELLTIKGLNALKNTKVICVPKGREEGSSLALSIVRKIVNLDGKEIIEAYFPMIKTRRQNTEDRTQKTEHRRQTKAGLDAEWNATVETISVRLKQGSDVAFITLGDPTIYSTFYYLYDKLVELLPDLNIEIIPGVSSITASAARAKISLGLADEKIAILPANYMGDLRSILETFDTVVLMKVHKVFNQIVELLQEMNLLDQSAYIVRAGMDEEKIFRNIKDVRQEDLDYFSMVIIRK
ncbi:MAG: precorrin-2 C(20)-methyltransferase [Nitrospirae bacterium]|nr:precorrin-2 C(20)-methyltransferase [Nitrospirota bacterium]